MFNRRQTVEIIDKLIELTQHSQISWESENPPAYMNNMDSRVDVVYIAKHLGRIFRVYKYHYKYFIDEERYSWSEQVNFEFIDGYGNIMGEFSSTPNAIDLLRAIQFQNPNINGFYKDLFGM